MARKRNKRWSYNAGEKGRNWVRAFEMAPDKFYLEWFEQETNEAGDPVRKRRSILLRDVSDAATAVQRAEQLAARFEEMDPDLSGPLTLRTLFHHYHQEVTPTKSNEESRAHDQRAAAMFLGFFGTNADPTSLGRARYNAFVKARREGTIPGIRRKVGDRTIERDVRFMHAVFNWATIEREGGSVLMQRNPWQGFPIPTEKNPVRVALTPEIEEKLLQHSSSWRFRLALVLCRETGRRLSAVRLLRWSDVDVAGRRVRWAPENDKNRRGRVTPISARAAKVLREAPQGLGNTWVFPSPSNPTEVCGKDYFSLEMRRVKRRAGLDIRGLGFHSGKRAKVRDPDFRELPSEIRAAFVDTNATTLDRIYDDVALPDLERAMERLEKRRAG